MRKGQITVFIMIAIILVIIVAGALVITDGLSFIRKDSRAGLGEFVNACVAQTVQNGLVVMGQQGGVVTLPEAHHPVLQTRYWWDNGTPNPMTEAEIVQELAAYVNTYIDDCVQFDEIPVYNLVSKGAPSTTITLTALSVVARMNYPLKFMDEKGEWTIEEFITEQDAQLKKIVEIAQGIIGDQTGSMFMLETKRDQGIDIDVTAINQELIISLKDPNYLIENIPYEFIFALR